MFGQRDEFLFHYTTAEAAFEYILPDHQLRLSPYYRMRDPLENKEWEPGDFGGGYFKDGEFGDEEALQTLAKASKALARIRRQVKVLALTLDPPEDPVGDPIGLFTRGYASARLWEQYAENHAGVCLAFSREELDQRIRADLNSREESPTPPPQPALYRQPVRYTTAGLAGATDAKSLILGPDTLDAENIANHVRNHFGALFFLKASDW